LPTTQNARLHELAKRGAEMRLGALLEEMSALTKMFPDLKGGSNGRLSASGTATTTDESSQPIEAAPVRRRKPGRRRWTTAQRKEAAQRMKAYWAKRQRA
jgi:hypothetical protein